MVSGFVCICHGFMSIDGTPTEVQEIMERIKARSSKAYQYMQIGKEREGRWNGNYAAGQLRDTVIPIAKYLHPGAELHFIFDRSSNHRARAPGTINVGDLTLKDGGKRIPMLPTNHVTFNATNSFDITTYHYQYLDGETKGLPQLLSERGLYRRGMKLKDCKAVLQEQPDVIYAQVPHIQHILRGAGCHLILLPSCHPELNFIELIWAYMKRKFRDIPPSERKGLMFRPAVESILESIRKAFPSAAS